MTPKTVPTLVVLLKICVPAPSIVIFPLEVLLVKFPLKVFDSPASGSSVNVAESSILKFPEPVTPSKDLSPEPTRIVPDPFIVSKVSPVRLTLEKKLTWPCSTV